MSTLAENLFKLKRSRRFGRYLVATRDIERGETIFKESPLIVYPTIGEYQKEHQINCIACYRLVDTNNDSTYECENCRWPFCSISCSEDSYHRTLECDIFKNSSVRWSTERIGYLYLVRCLALKTKDPQTWKDLLKLVSKYGTKNWFPSTYRSLYNEEVKQFIEDCGLKVSTSKLEKLIKIFDINKYCLGSGEYSVVFLNGSFFTHSCAPNVRCVKLKRGECRWNGRFVAQVNIKKGEILSIPYIERFISYGTVQRRVWIYDKFGFICKCARCKDQTEFNTFYSSIKCADCPGGWLHPPLKSLKMGYRCTRCSFTLALDDVESLENSFKQHVMSIININGSRKRRQKMLNELINKATPSFRLHQNHNLVIFAIGHWLAMCNLWKLLGLTPKIKALYTTVINRAKRSLAVRRLFGTHSQRIELEAIICTAIARYEFKCIHSLPVIRDARLKSKVRKLRKLVKHLRQHIDSENAQSYEGNIISFVEDIEHRYADRIDVIFAD